jgi:hypothetical protein
MRGCLFLRPCLSVPVGELYTHITCLIYLLTRIAVWLGEGTITKSPNVGTENDCRQGCDNRFVPSWVRVEDQASGGTSLDSSSWAVHIGPIFFSFFLFQVLFSSLRERIHLTSCIRHWHGIERIESEWKKKKRKWLFKSKWSGLCLPCMHK